MKLKSSTKMYDKLTATAVITVVGLEDTSVAKVICSSF